jgi:2-phosphosulfolactate phosphatase
VRELYVIFDPEMLNETFLAGRTAVVLDVLRATSCMLTALANGAARVKPVAEVDEAFRLAASLPQGTTVLGGERDGLQIDGFDVGNTPQEFSRERVGGRTVIMTTSNGTRAVLMALPAERVYIAALVNVAAITRTLLGLRGDVVLVGSGTQRRVSWEDTFSAGAIVERLVATSPEGTWHLTDSALIALEAWRAAKSDVDAALRRGRGGWNVIRVGVDAAFATCGAVDALDVVGRVHKEPLEIVAERP